MYARERCGRTLLQRARQDGRGARRCAPQKKMCGATLRAPDEEEVPSAARSRPSGSVWGDDDKEDKLDGAEDIVMVQSRNNRK